MELADDLGSIAGLAEEAVAGAQLAAAPKLVAPAQGLQRTQTGGRSHVRHRRRVEAAGQRLPSAPRGRPTGRAELLDGGGEVLGQQSELARRVADRDRALRQPVQLGRLAGEAAPAIGLQIAQGDQPLQVVEGHRTMDTRGLGDLGRGTRRRVGIEAVEDVAPREVLESGHRPLHRGLHPACSVSGMS